MLRWTGWILKAVDLWKRKVTKVTPADSYSLAVHVSWKSSQVPAGCTASVYIYTENYHRFPWAEQLTCTCILNIISCFFRFLKFTRRLFRIHVRIHVKPITGACWLVKLTWVLKLTVSTTPLYVYKVYWHHHCLTGPCWLLQLTCSFMLKSSHAVVGSYIFCLQCIATVSMCLYLCHSCGIFI